MNDGFSLTRKDWDSDFFAREIYALDAGAAPLGRGLASALADLDAAGVWGIECHLGTARFRHAASLEELGFRLVDSRMVFISTWTTADIPDARVPYGTLRPVGPADLPEVHRLTVDHLVDNAGFRSRFKDRRLFTREESIRYYDAWNALALDQDPDLFAVWEVDGRIAGYFNYLRHGEHDGLPLYKGVLTAVDPAHRGHDAHNLLQAYLFRRFGVERWALDNTTQITNLAVVKNHIKARKRFQDAIFTFYRLGDSTASWLTSE